MPLLPEFTDLGTVLRRFHAGVPKAGANEKQAFVFHACWSRCARLRNPKPPSPESNSQIAPGSGTGATSNPVMRPWLPVMMVPFSSYARHDGADRCRIKGRRCIAAGCREYR